MKKLFLHFFRDFMAIFLRVAYLVGGASGSRVVLADLNVARSGQGGCGLLHGRCRVDGSDL